MYLWRIFSRRNFFFRGGFLQIVSKANWLIPIMRYQREECRERSQKSTFVPFTICSTISTDNTKYDKNERVQILFAKVLVSWRSEHNIHIKRSVTVLNPSVISEVSNVDDCVPVKDEWYSWRVPSSREFSKSGGTYSYIILVEGTHNQQPQPQYSLRDQITTYNQESVPAYTYLYGVFLHW